MRSGRVAALLMILMGLGAMLACSSSSKPEGGAPAAASASQPKKAEATLYTGEEAFSRMMGLASRWASDAQPVHLESDVTDSTGQDGKSTIWRGYFGSPSLRTVKVFVCSGSRRKDAPPSGVSANAGESPYTADIAALAFQPFMLKIDSDKAYATAQQHGGEAIVKGDPKQPVAYLLEWDKRMHVPLWYVIYGKTMTDRKGLGVINATTGAFVRGGK